MEKTPALGKAHSQADLPPGTGWAGTLPPICHLGSGGLGCRKKEFAVWWEPTRFDEPAEAEAVSRDEYPHLSSGKNEAYTRVETMELRAGSPVETVSRQLSAVSLSV